MIISDIKRGTVGVLLLLLSIDSHATTATYRLTVANEWTATTFPLNYPTDARFSWLGGGMHDDNLTVWRTGGLSSPGMELMAENGDTTLLSTEIEEAGGTSIQFQQWFCPPDTTSTNCGDPAVELVLDTERPLLTLVSKVGPSPDWFVGTDALSLIRSDGAWRITLILALNIHDAGTKDGNIPSTDFPATVPSAPISVFGYDPSVGSYSEIIGGQHVEFVGHFRFDLVDVVGDTDGDGIDDVDDNCIVAVNADQRDTDADGYGNLCDADLNGDGIVSTVDLGLFRQSFFDSGDLDADFNGDGVVNVLDLGVMRRLFFGRPGPSAVDILAGR